MIDERARHELYLSLERELGPAEADTMMDLLPPVGWADVATKRDLDGLETHMNLRFDAVDKRFEAVDKRFDAVDKRFDAMEGRFENMEQAFATKQDLAEALQAQTRLMVMLMVGMMLTLTTILLTAVALVR
ncbi:MAG: hypothetical protein ABI276_05295 [Acidimicrobiales bacterium]